MNETYILYTSVVRYAVPSLSPVITRTDTYYVTVTCLINRTQTPDNAFNPASRTPPPQANAGRYALTPTLIMLDIYKTMHIYYSGTAYSCRKVCFIKFYQLPGSRD